MRYSKKYFQDHTDHYLGQNLVKIPSFAWVKRELDLKPGQKILDAGCGTGYLLNFVCGRNVKGVGVDISKAAVKKAKKLFPRHSFTQGDLEKRLPFENESFDKIFSFNVIEHLEDQEKALRELKRVLKKKGVLVIGTNIKDSLAWRLFKFFLGGDPTHRKEFTAKEFIDFIDRFFKVEKTIESSCIARFPAPVNLFLHLFLKGDILVKARKK